jgi:hypothetical protein
MVTEADVKATLLAFLDKDDTPADLLETLAELKKMKKFMGDGLSRVHKELNKMSGMFKNYDKR